MQIVKESKEGSERDREREREREGEGETKGVWGRERQSGAGSG